MYSKTMLAENYEEAGSIITAVQINAHSKIRKSIRHYMMAVKECAVKMKMCN